MDGLIRLADLPRCDGIENISVEYEVEKEKIRRKNVSAEDYRIAIKKLIHDTGSKIYEGVNLAKMKDYEEFKRYLISLKLSSEEYEKRIKQYADENGI